MRAVQRRAQTLAQLNIELAKVEAKEKATAVGIGGGLGAVAIVFVVYGIGFAFASAAAGLSEAVSLWLALLIVAGILFLAAALAAFLARRFIRKATPATPAAAIEEAGVTIGALKNHV